MQLQFDLIVFSKFLKFSKFLPICEPNQTFIRPARENFNNFGLLIDT